MNSSSTINILIFSIFFVVRQQSVAIIERFGRFVRTAHPGLRVKIPLIERIAERVNLRVQQLIVEIEVNRSH